MKSLKELQNYRKSESFKIEDKIELTSLFIVLIGNLTFE